jgi:hypothetical protein
LKKDLNAIIEDITTKIKKDLTTGKQTQSWQLSGSPDEWWWRNTILSLWISGDQILLSVREGVVP